MVSVIGTDKEGIRVISITFKVSNKGAMRIWGIISSSSGPTNTPHVPLNPVGK